MSEIICGDCLEVMKGFAGESVDLFVTSPPYNLKNSSGNGMKDGINFNAGYFLPTYEVIYLIAKPGFRLMEWRDIEQAAQSMVVRRR